MSVIASRYDNGASILIEFEADHVTAVSSLENTGSDSSLRIAPGLVDLQVNGVQGIDFSSSECRSEEAEAAARVLASCGVTRFLPTVTTNSFEALRASMLRLCDSFQHNGLFARMAGGIHLEGPYIATEDGPRGAHPKQFCKPPDWDEFCRLQDASENRIKLITLSPEYEAASQFIEKAVALGVRVAIGHTSANTQQITDAVSAGATLSTHLGNGAHGTIRRHPNYIWDQLADDRLCAMLITDGHHLPASVVKSFVRCKGIENTILVSDITALSGKPPGIYRNTILGDVEVLDDGRLVVAGQRQYLAGASMPLIECVGIAAAFAEIDLHTAIDMATKNPCKALGWDDMTGDWILYRENKEASPADRIKLLATICRNELTHNSDEFAAFIF